MSKSDIIESANKIYEKVILYYGLSKYKNFTPYLDIEDSPYSDGDDKDLIGEYCSMDNSLILYWKNIPSLEVLSRTIIHEYKHYLQSPRWMRRYYTMGYDYNNHPYEIQALNEEENWKKFV